MSASPVDSNEDYGENDFTIQCVIELEEVRLGRKLTQIEIQQIINCSHPEERVEDPQKIT